MKKIRIISGIITLVSTISLGTVRLQAQVLADSGAEFSGVQGSNNWYYGFYNLSADFVPGYDPTNDFTSLPVFSGGDWYINGSYGTHIYQNSMHPSTLAQAGQEHWPIRRWVSEVKDLVQIHGRFAKGAAGGDGVTGMVFINGRKVWEHWISGGDTTGVNYSFVVGVHQGDFVDFALSAAGNNAYDFTDFTGIVERADFVLSTATAIEVGVPTIPGQRYQMETSTDLQTWTSIGSPFTGTGDRMYFMFSPRELGSPAYFRAQLIP
jgi:hypothetical protein